MEAKEEAVSRKLWILSASAVGILSLAFVLGVVSRGEAKTEAANRTLYMTAVEWKGSANISKEPYPGPVPTGGGYESFAPGHEEVADEQGKWAIETYRFDTAVVMAYEGERVTLKIFGVNAAKHDIVIPAFKQKFTVKRGAVSTVSFNVKKAGIYQIICLTHPPSHQADLVVLERPGS